MRPAIGTWVVLAFGSRGTQVAQVVAYGLNGKMYCKKFSATRRRFTKPRWTLPEEIVRVALPSDLNRLRSLGT